MADLCLDTVPFNGGTTTSDALWAGVAVVTCAGRSFAARMSSSLLNAVGLPGVVAQSMHEYERVALQPALKPDRLVNLCSNLRRGRRSSVLLNTERFCRHLEAEYRAVVQRNGRGHPPATLRVPLLGVSCEAP